MTQSQSDPEIEKPSSAIDQPNRTRAMETVLIEYQEAANSYARGVEVGERTLRGFVLLNFALLGLYSIPISDGDSGNYLALLEWAAPFIGVVACCLFFLLINHYCRHLSNTLTRCAELEVFFDGQLFTRNKKISEGRFNTQKGLYFGCAIFLILWIIAGFRQFEISAAI